MKDNFSLQSNQYVKYRPTYPTSFFDYLNTIVKDNNTAWDCGTGNGQVAAQLAKLYKKVYATDISKAQLEQAFQHNSIEYSVQPAEETTFPNDFFDLIIVAQAVHWFDFDKFYKEVKRTAKNEAKLVIIGYGKLKINPIIDQIINDFYKNDIGKYWDDERKYIDENYQTIPFPFQELKVPIFSNTYNWTLDHLIGYLNTWSAVKHYSKQNGENPVDLIYAKLEENWEKNTTKKINFPLLLRIGNVF